MEAPEVNISGAPPTMYKTTATLTLCLLLSAGCSDPTSDPPAAVKGDVTGISVEFISSEIKTRAMFHAPADGVAKFRVTNRVGRPLQFWGVNGESPVVRIAAWDGAVWVEKEPPWIECATGLDVGTLESGASEEIHVYLPASGIEYRVGVGYWEDQTDAHPPWGEWTWNWSDPLVLR
jgi:hypothetical protein